MAFEDLHRPLSAAGFKGAVKWIILVSGVVLILQQFEGAPLIAYLGLTPVDVLRHGRVWELVTYFWLHGGLFHWLFNMFILWMFGRELEVRWGTAAFVRFVLVTMLGSAACVLLLSPHSTIPTIGSSGVVFGLLVAFAMVFPEATMYLYFVIPVKAWQAAAIFAFIELFASFGGGGEGIARFAHLGGMLTGFLYLRYAGRLTGPFEHVYERWQFSHERHQRMKQAYKPGVELHEVTDEVAHEVDRILDKILKEGVGSLSSREKELMNKYSRMKR